MPQKDARPVLSKKAIWRQYGSASPRNVARAYFAAFAYYLRHGTYYMYRRIQYSAFSYGFNNIISREESRLLALPLEVRMLIYEYVLGHQVIHIERTVDSSWTYFVCTCCHTSETLSGEGSNAQGPALPISTNSAYGQSWGMIIPWCQFDYARRLGHDKGEYAPGYWPKPPSRDIKQTLNLGLFLVNKQIYHEASMIFRHTSIFAFRDVNAFSRFASDPSKIASRVGNMVLYVEPLGREMHFWNQWLGEQVVSKNSRALGAFSDLQRVRIVVGKMARFDGDQFWSVYGLLALSRLQILDIAVDVSLWNGHQEGFQRFASSLEEKLIRPWDDDVEMEFRELEAEYNSSHVGMLNNVIEAGTSCTFLSHTVFKLK